MSLRRYSNPPNKSTVPGVTSGLTVQPGGLTAAELAALQAAGAGGGETTEPEGTNPCAVTVTAIRDASGHFCLTLTDVNGDPIADATVTLGGAAE